MGRMTKEEISGRLQACRTAREQADRLYEAREWGPEKYIRVLDKIHRSQAQLLNEVPAKEWTRGSWIAAREKLGIDNPMRRYPIRSRKDADAAVILLDHLKLRATQSYMAGKISMWQKMRVDRLCDEGERIVKGKLVGLHFRITEQEQERSNSIQVRELGDGTIQRYAAGEWIDSSVADIRKVQDATGKEIRERKPKRGEDWQIEGEDYFQAPRWSKVSREEGRVAAKEGEVVRWNEDGSAEVQG